jgi:hypothetical protein
MRGSDENTGSLFSHVNLDGVFRRAIRCARSRQWWMPGSRRSMLRSSDSTRAGAALDRAGTAIARRTRADAVLDPLRVAMASFNTASVLLSMDQDDQTIAWPRKDERGEL